MHSLPSWTSQQIVDLRPAIKRPVPGDEPLTVLSEIEAADAAGTPVNVTTIFLRGSECRYRCLMCDLWQHTYPGQTPRGSIAAQVAGAVGDCLRAEGSRSDTELAKPPQWIKLYNASNFFSPVNVPVEDLDKVAACVQSYQRVVVENHPKLLAKEIEHFKAQLGGRLEVAMGLETVHAETLLRLNKRMTTADFRAACLWLRQRDIDFRAFLLLRPPGMSRNEGIEWCWKSAEFARECGVRHISLIPVRGGNGAIERLVEMKLFEPPDAADLATAIKPLLQWEDVVVTVDLWDWPLLPFAGADVVERDRLKSSLERANLDQKWSSD